MQELEFINETFLQILSSDVAQNIFNTSVHFTSGKALQENINISKEIAHFCRLYQQPEFFDLPDIRPELEYSKKNYILSENNIFNIYRTLLQWSQLRHLDISETEFPLYYAFIYDIYFPKDLLKVWIKSFDNNGHITDSASPALKNIRTMKQNLRKKIEKILQKQLHNNEDLAENRIAFREDRYLLPFKSVAKNRVNGIVHGISSSGLVTYIEPQEVVSLNNELLSVDNLEHQEIQHLLRVWSSLIQEQVEEILVIIVKGAELEILHSKYQFMRTYNASYSSINLEKKIILENAFNPFLLIKKGQKNVIPVTITLENPHCGMIITGPNAGGKSAALKTLALCIDMFLRGLPIPVGHSSLPFFTNILLEIGDAQNLDDELSTFSGHLYHIKEILAQCSEDMIVLIDEIAHATDPVEGEALACAIIDELILKRTCFAITTHYKQVKMKAFEHSQIKTYSTGFDINTLSPNFLLYPNTIGESYALKIASRIGLPKHIVAHAADFIQNKKDRTEHILSNIEEFEKNLRNNQLQQIQLQKDLEKQKEDLKTQKEQLTAQSIKLKNEGLKLADQELEICLRELSHIQQDLKTQPKQSSKKLKNVKDLLERKKAEITKISRPLKTQLSVGETVFVSSLNKNAIIEGINNNYIIIRSGIIKVSVKKSDIFEADIQKKNTPTSTQYKVSSAHSVDVHGLRSEDALKIIDKHLYSAFVDGFSTFTIIHGKGTGALQKAIHAYLKTIPEVHEFSFARPQEGGSGKTIVHFM